MDNYEELLVEIEKDLEKVLFIILDIQSIYNKYLDKANKIDKKCDKMRT